MEREEAQRESNLKPAQHEAWKLLESAPDAIVIVNRTGRIAFVNSHTERMFGYAPHELLGEPVEILVPEATRPAHVARRSEFSRAPRTREMGSGLELKGRRKDGRTFPVEISLSFLGEPEGQFVVSAIRDVTERRQIQEELRLSEERFRRLVAEVKDYAIFMLDPEGKVKTWNEGAERIKGYRADEIIGRHFSCFYSSEDVERGKPEEQLNAAAREGRSEDDGWRIRKDGSRFWASVVITALHDPNGKLLGFSKVTRDITERKRIREAFLFEVTNALLSNLDISKLLGAIGLCVRQVKPFDYATLALYDSDTKKLRIHSLGAAPGLPEIPSGDLIAIAGSPHGWAYVSRKPLLLAGVSGEEFPHELPQHLARTGVKSGCWMPLIGREGPLGTLNLFSRQANAFQQADLDALGHVASQV